MKTTMITLALAAITMTANANNVVNTWRVTVSSTKAPRMEVRHNDSHITDWRHCNHNHLDRYGNNTYCHDCGVELVWKGNKKNGRYEVIAPRTSVTNNHGGAKVSYSNGHRK